MSCTDMGLTSLPEPDMTSLLTRSLRALLLSGNKLTLTSHTLVKLHWLGRLDLSRNNLEQLPEAMFSDLKNLFELDLSYNMIHTLDGEAFSALVSLKFLNLHGNQLSILRIDTLGALTSLTHLVLTGNKLSDVSQDAFDGLQALETINTDAYKFCCIAKHVQNCTPEPDEFSSCEDLMSNSALQVSHNSYCSFPDRPYIQIVHRNRIFSINYDDCLQSRWHAHPLDESFFLSFFFFFFYLMSLLL